MDTEQKKKPGLPSRLTPMQMKFAELLIYFEGRKFAYECAVEAGYSKDTARSQASQLQNPKLYPHVVKYIGELKEERNKKYGVNYGGHLTELGRIRDEALKARSFSAATIAEKARGQVGGLYIEQKIVRTGKIEDLSEEELDNRIANIVDDNARIIEVKEESNKDPNQNFLNSLNQKATEWSRDILGGGEYAEFFKNTNFDLNSLSTPRFDVQQSYTPPGTVGLHDGSLGANDLAGTMSGVA